MGNEKRGIRNEEYESRNKKWRMSYGEEDMSNKKSGMRKKE